MIHFLMKNIIQQNGGVSYFFIKKCEVTRTYGYQGTYLICKREKD